MKKHYMNPLTIEELAALSDDQIDTSDIPELNADFWTQAKIMPPRTKANISLRLSKDVVNFFKGQDPKGYTARMATVLTAYMHAHQPK